MAVLLHFINLIFIHWNCYVGVCFIYLISLWQASLIRQPKINQGNAMIFYHSLAFVGFFFFFFTTLILDLTSGI